MAEPKFIVLMETEGNGKSKLLSVLGARDSNADAKTLLKEKLAERLKNPDCKVDGRYYIAQVKAVLVAKARREVDLEEVKDNPAPSVPAATVETPQTTVETPQPTGEVPTPTAAAAAL